MQMVEIAKALSEKALVLILDEPTSALSEAEIDKLMDILGILKNNGITCIYITHKLDELFRVTDRVTVMYEMLKYHPIDKRPDTGKISEVHGWA